MTRSWLAAICTGFFASALLLSCTGTETGNPPPRATVSFLLESSEPERVSVGEGGPGLSVVEMRVGVGNVTVASDCISMDEPVTVTDVTRDSTLNLTMDADPFELPGDNVCLLEIRIVPRELDWADVHSGVDSDLTIGIAGTTMAGDPLFIETVEPLEAFFRLPIPGYTVEEGGRLALTLDVASLLDPDELDPLQPSPSGEVVVSATENQAVLDGIHSRWAGSWTLYALEEGADPVALTSGTDM